MLLPDPPVAACLAHGLTGATGTVLVFDLGAGTFDVSVLIDASGSVEVVATSGAPTSAATTLTGGSSSGSPARRRRRRWRRRPAAGWRRRRRRRRRRRKGRGQGRGAPSAEARQACDE